jgi:hypothetical protein
MNTREKIEHRIAKIDNEIMVFAGLAAVGNTFAEGYVLGLRDQIRWLKWVLEDLA